MTKNSAEICSGKDSYIHSVTFTKK